MPARVIDSADGHDAVEPRYACGRCGEIVLAGAPLHALASDGGPRKTTGVRCWSCAGISFLQVVGSDGRPRARRRPGA